MSLSQNILDAVEILANSSISKAGYDRTIQAQVLSCEDASIGKYRCRYQDSTIYAYSNNFSTSYNKGDYVYILVPSNDMKKEKTILCTSNRQGNNFISEITEQDMYDLIGNNCIISNKEEYFLNSQNLDYSYSIYTDEGQNNEIILNTDTIKKYFNQADAFKIGLFVKTNIPIKRQSRGSYGIQLVLVFKDNTLERDVERKYIFKEQSMIKNPYKYKNNTKQSSVFQIDGKNFVKIKSITLFNKDFPQAENGVSTGSLSEGDIIFSGISLYGLKKNNSIDAQKVTITFKTPYGTFLTNTIETLPIIAEVRVNNKLVSSNQNLKFYWGIEDTGISSSSMYFNKYLGNGWRCLNQYNTIVKDSTVDWIPNNGTFNYTKDYDDNLLSVENNLKVAVVFNNITYSNEILISNKEKIDNDAAGVVLTSNDGTVFYYDKGTPSITCAAGESQPRRRGEQSYSYKWGQENNKGLLTSLEDSEEVVPVVMKTVTNFTKMKCSIYQGDEFKGTGSITLKNSLSRDELSLIEGWDGDTVQIEENQVLSPRVGAGKKDQDGNFTGVVMGLLKNYPPNVDIEEIREEIGLFGYANNDRTFFLNSKNGSAIFGKMGSGSIVIDPSSGKALLYSGNFWTEYSEDLLPVSYEESNQSGQGLLIDLSSAVIRAKNHSTLNSINPGFFLSEDGLSFGSKAKISSQGIMTLGQGATLNANDQGFSTRKCWTIDGNSQRAYIGYNSNTFINAQDNAVYIGTDGISLGKKFSVSNEGILKVGQNVGDSINGTYWTINGNNNVAYIAHNTSEFEKVDNNKTDAVYIGTDGISLGKKFSVNNQGVLKVGQNVESGAYWTINGEDGSGGSSGKAYISYNTSNIGTVNSGTNSVYIGTDGLSLGTKFLVTSEGIVKIGNDVVGNGPYWTINGDSNCAYIAYNTSEFTKVNNNGTDAVYIGTDGISLGTKFSVDNQGVLTATEGHIGNWLLNSTSLYYDGDLKSYTFGDDSSDQSEGAQKSYHIALQAPEDKSYVFSIGESKSNPAFRVRYDGRTWARILECGFDDDKGLVMYYSYKVDENHGINQPIFRPMRNQNGNGYGRIGTSDYPFNIIRANEMHSTAYHNDSDKKEKNHIDILNKNESKGSLSFAQTFIYSLSPSVYTFKKDQKNIHFGFYAQDLYSTLNKLAPGKFFGVVSASLKKGNENKNFDINQQQDENLRWSLAYNQIIAPLVAVVQKQKQEIEELSNRISKLEEKGEK